MSAPCPDDVPHGTNRYKNYGCRCDECKAAMATYVREWRRKNGTYDVTAQSRAIREAARRYRERYPKAWARLLHEETEKAKAEAASGVEAPDAPAA